MLDNSGMTNNEKILSLFEYIKAIYAKKYKVITNVKEQHWKRFIKDIPDDPENITIYYPDRVESESDENESDRNNNVVLLKVKKPEFQRCPEPTYLIKEWLEPGWDKFSNIPKCKETMPVPNKTSLDFDNDSNQLEIVNFKDSINRTQTFEKWIALRDIWVHKQLIIEQTRKLFTELYNAHTDIERESETLEFMVGNGFIQDRSKEEISHPILSKRVKFDFDAKENIIRICDTDTDPELYELLLEKIDVNLSALRKLKEELEENFYHPLDRNDTPDFLKTLTHRLCPNSKFIENNDDQPSSEDRIVVTCSSPVFFIRKRIDGTLKTIQEIIDNIKTTGYVPAHLIDLVGEGAIEVSVDKRELTIEEQLAALSGENTEILLAKEANREQLEIAERIGHYNAVLVQGPPGTGKTHTIANLLGHFLAQGKNVLVTSHTQKALSVLKNQVTKEIQSLCVSVLDDTNRDMERSVDGISDYLSKHTSNELTRKIESCSRQRTEIIEKLATVRKKIFTIKYSEFKPIAYNGISYSPAEAAKYVRKNIEGFSYIPGRVTLHKPLPASIDELYSLYKSNSEITFKDEEELSCEIPNPKLLLSPTDFSVNIKTENENNINLDSIGKILSCTVRHDYTKGCVIAEFGSNSFVLMDAPDEHAIEDLESYVNSFHPIDSWMIQAATDGNKGGGYRKNWEILITSIEDTASYSDSIVTSLFGKNVSFCEGVIPSQLKPQISKLLDVYQNKGKVSNFYLFFNKSIRNTLLLVSVNGNPPESEEDCKIILYYIALLTKRTETEKLWNELMAKNGLPTFTELGDKPEEKCRQIIPKIQQYLDWYKNEYSKMTILIGKAGFNKNTLFDYSDLDSELTRTYKTLKTIQNKVPLYIKAAKLYIQLAKINQRTQQSISVLSEGKRKKSAVCVAAISALHERNNVKYEEEYRSLSQLYDKYTLKTKRIDTLAKIEPFAPVWADAIKTRKGIHGGTECPSNIDQAWQWKQFSGIIEEITSEPYGELLNKAVSLSKELRTKTGELAANKAWYHLLKRVEDNNRMRQALAGWRLTVRKIGKGTGKNAPLLRKEARKLMAECQVSVPAWIMPVSKALESYNPSKNSFDIIIVDEASQSDVSALAIIYMAKKIIIVGDDKQVSPMAIGIDLDDINKSSQWSIKDIIPNSHLYDLKTSLYDIAATTYQPLMLREHFRCMPDIIGYSNKFSYDGAIKPLRDANNCVIFPSVVPYRVSNGQRKENSKINIKEAETIVALMMACMEQPEYEGKTFGAISLLGDEQAVNIQQIILRKLGPQKIEERRILCGNASHFQGDERDIIFLSLVDSNDRDGPLRKTGEGADRSTKQRYNVAASRAKDQLWIIHSLDYSRDLQTGDLRRDLLEYADNPQAYADSAKNIELKAESPFEEAVGKHLVSAGYNVVQQWEVGAYRIDIVVQYGGTKIAIECDGEQYHSGEEKVRADMERQTILERLAWRFIRIRGSEYYRDPENTMKRVIDELTNYGILKESIVVTKNNQADTELWSRVTRRAEEIMNEWESEDGAYTENPNMIESDDGDYSDTKPAVSDPKSEKLKNEITGESRVKTSQHGQAVLPLFKDEKDANNSKISQEKKSAHVLTHKKTTKAQKQVKNIMKKQETASSGEQTGILNMFDQNQIDYIDNRKQSGMIWVLYSTETKGKLEKGFAKELHKFIFEQRGSTSTHNKPAWRIMMS